MDFHTSQSLAKDFEFSELSGKVAPAACGQTLTKGRRVWLLNMVAHWEQMWTKVVKKLKMMGRSTDRSFITHIFPPSLDTNFSRASNGVFFVTAHISL